MILRDETAADHPAIRALVTAAFATAPHTSGTEAAIIDALREAGALSLSLLACDPAGDILGHVAFSPVLIDGIDRGWLGLGPLAVTAEHRRRGVGGELVRAGLDRLRGAGAGGIVLLGDPAYYGRFGFRSHPGLRLPGVPEEYFQALGLNAAVPHGTVTYNSAFYVT